MAQGAGQVRNMWPEILEAVKNRRRFTWILLSQNAQVAGFDGTTLQLGFINAGARDTFGSSGSEDVLKQALAEQFNVQWKVEAIIDPSGGSAGPGGTAPTPTSGPGSYGNQPAAGQGGYGQNRPQSASPAPAPAAPPAPRPAQPSSQPSHRSGAAPADTAPGSQNGAEPPRPPEAYEPPPVSLEDDVPEADDPDMVDSALSGHDLIVRELGATVVEEYTNE
jgi:DNA polymerase-3 subunit gamma/tau